MPVRPQLLRPLAGWCVHALSLLTLLMAPAAMARSFWAEGADTGGGLGARYMALGGAGVALSDDVHAGYYNPAGLTAVSGLELSVSRQLNARLHDINFLGAAWRLPLGPRWGLKATVAALYFPRIHSRASGAFNDSDFESLFLRYLLPGISGRFDGDIDSKTKTYRLALGLAPLQDSPWSLGLYIDRIDCQSTFCGIHATSKGYTVSSTGARAIAAGIGLRYQLTPSWTLAGSISDLGTRLTVNTVTTDDAGTRSQQAAAEFPRKVVIGATWQARHAVVVAMDYEITQGRYGKNQLDLQALRLGAEKTAGNWAYRAGAMVPLKIDSGTTGRLRSPYPVAPTLGLGWRGGRLKVDLVVYAHAVMSMHEGKPSAAADLSLSAEF
jgi:hypothetical protein